MNKNFKTCMKEYARTHIGEITKVRSYGFEFSEYDKKNVNVAKRKYWVMKSYFY